jgi:hypothetical protein
VHDIHPADDEPASVQTSLMDSSTSTALAAAAEAGLGPYGAGADGSTMGGAPGAVDLLGPIPTESRPPSPLGAYDRDAETMARAEGAPAEESEPEDEATRAVPRDELFRHQDAHVVVGPGAYGDDATLAIAPERRAELQAVHGGAAFAATMMNLDAGVPAFPPPPGQAFGHAPPRPPQQPPHPGGGWQPPPQVGFADPMMPTYDPTGGRGGHGDGGPSGFGGPPPSAHDMPVSGAYPLANATPGFGGRVPAPNPALSPPPWTQPQGGQAPSRFNPQLLMLVVVGAVCLTIFIVGIVLFLTTNF